MEINMTREELLKHHEVLCKQARDLMDKKNRDYAGKGGTQPFANFTRVETMGICSTEQGFLVRLTDKLSRLSSIVESGTVSVTNETFEDTMIDVINYMVLLSAYTQEKKLTTQYGDSLFGCTSKEIS
jgi:hypothetical protein